MIILAMDEYVGYHIIARATVFYLQYSILVCRVLYINYHTIEISRWLEQKDDSQSSHSRRCSSCRTEDGMRASGPRQSPGERRMAIAILYCLPYCMSFTVEIKGMNRYR